MQAALVAIGAIASIWNGWIGQANLQLSAIVGDRWLVQSVNSHSLNQLTEGNALTFMAYNQSPVVSGEPTVVQVYPVQADILAVDIETGTVIRGQQIPYDPEPGDRIQDGNQVQRDGNDLGILIGPEKDILYTYDQYAGQDISADQADRASSYRITSPTDDNFKTAQEPQQVFRKSKPTDLAETTRGKRWPMRHTVYLKLPQPLQVGEEYRLAFDADDLAPVAFTYAPRQQRSEAVHVSQVGFRPSDPVKVGFLSTWMGSGGALDYREGAPFWVIDDATNEVAYEGTVRLSVAKDTREDPLRNYNLTNVYEMDFQDLQQPGMYRLCVDAVGCSFSFPIQEDVWQDAFKTSARGLYHQRSGIAIGPPYTDYRRSRAFHPDDGVVVYQSRAKLMDTRMGIGSDKPFDALKDGITDETLPDAWGGYFDAGDWDRRIQHLGAAQSLLELAELFPQEVAAIALNIPESDNALPDVVDEALWGIDFFRRLQKPNGGVPGGVESAAHPKRGETSWQESLQVMAYAPDIWSSYWYASAAARAGVVLRSLNDDRAQLYEDSALKAFAYAEQQFEDSPDDGWPRQVHDLRNLSALELWRLTGDDRWHQLFLDITGFADADQDSSSGKRSQSTQAAFLYARLDRAGIDPQVQARARQAVLQRADDIAALSEQTGYRWGKHHPNAPVGYGVGWASPAEVGVVLQAHHLEPDDRYLEAALRATQAALGANPDNFVYTTGLGQRSPQNPLILDQRIMAVAPPPGISVYGPMDIGHRRYRDYWFIKHFMRREMFPAPATWPPMELQVDVHLNVAMSEFTIHQTIGPAAYVWGYLAARD